jgi:hypothetical protein
MNRSSITAFLITIIRLGLISGTFSANFGFYSTNMSRLELLIFSF